MAVALCVGMIGSAFAYFSDVETSQGNTFTAGTLAMRIADNNEGWFDGAPVSASWQSPSNWAPGETITTGIIRLENVGTIDIKYLFTTYYNYSFTGADLASVIEVVEYWEYIPGYGWNDNIQPLQNLWSLVGNLAKPLTLKELIDASWVGDATELDYCTGSGYDTTPGPAIIVGGIYQTYLKLRFMETADNTYQGASCSFDIEYEGVQNNVAQKH